MTKEQKNQARESIEDALLIVAAVLIIKGVHDIFAPAAWIAGGMFLALLVVTIDR